MKDKLLKDELLKDKILKIQILVKKTPEIKNLEKEYKNEMIFYDSIEFNFPFNISDTQFSHAACETGKKYVCSQL